MVLPSNMASISSKLRFAVSGWNNHVLAAAAKLIPAKMIYRPQLMSFKAVGMYSANQKFTNQFVAVVILFARPRVIIGKISAGTTHAGVAQEMAKLAQ